MKIIGTTQQKPMSNRKILLRSLPSNPAARPLPAMARCLDMQRLHAGIPAAAPMMSLVARATRVRYRSRRFQRKALTNITPYGRSVLNIVGPRKAVRSIYDVRDEEPCDQGENWDLSGSPLPVCGYQNEEGRYEGTGWESIAVHCVGAGEKKHGRCETHPMFIMSGAS